jgi:hypothetical protein
MPHAAEKKAASPTARLFIALAVSALLHLLLIGIGSLNQNNAHSPAENNPPPKHAAKVKQTPPVSPDETPKLTRREIPMIFVETDSSQPAEPPPDTKFYGKQDTVAANPKIDPSKPLGETPLIEGQQDKIPSTADVPLASARPSPAPPPTPPQPPIPPAENRLPKPVNKTSDDAPQEISKPADTPKETVPPESQPDPTNAQIITPSPNPPPAPTPKTENPKPSDSPPAATPPQPQIAAVTQPPHPPAPIRPAPPTQRQIPARAAKMDQSSAQRRGNISLNVKGTPFGIYDEKLVAAVSRRWHLMLQDKVFGDRPGTVVITFILNQDGSVENVRIEEENVGPVLAAACVAAIQNSAPFDPFTEEMRGLLGDKHRECKFVFYY